MKALSIKQPWAAMIASGNKTIETRSWKTDYRGELLIVASQKPDLYWRAAIIRRVICADRFMCYGQALAIANLTDCRRMVRADEHSACCLFYPDLFAWVLEDIRPIKPFAVKGRLGLFEVELPEGVE